MAATPATFASDGRPGAATTACILWTAAPRPPATLTGLLAERGFALQAASDRFSAMAAACCAAAAGQRVVVILDEPEHLKGSGELVEAIRGRLSAAVIWTFDVRRKPQLNSLDPGADRPASTNRPANGTVPAPLRLVGEPAPRLEPATDDAIDDAAEAGPEADSNGRAAILSSEELEMLLADEPEQRGSKR